MKKILIIGGLLIWLSLSVRVQAQINNNYNLYFTDLYTLNPAGSHANEEMSASLFSNFANAGFEGAPTTVNLLVNGPVKNKIGLGFRMFNDRRGAFRTNRMVASYAYKIRLAAENHNLNLGLSAGIHFQNFQVADINASRLDDPLLANADLYNKKYFVNEFGLLYQYKNLTVGFAAPFVVQLYNQYIGHVSYQYDLPSTEGFSIIPQLLYQYLPEGKSQVDGGVKFQYKPVWLALTYRSNNNFLTAVGARYQQYELGYGFEINNEELSILSGSTHEIMLRYHFELNLFRKKSASYDKDSMPWEEDN